MIVRVLQQISKHILPCFDTLKKEEIEKTICLVGAHNIIGKNKQLILNFPSDIFEVDAIKITHVREAKDIDQILEMPHSIYKGFTKDIFLIGKEDFKAWALHPSNLFLLCEHKNQFMGMFFSLRLKPESFQKLMSFEVKLAELSDEDFAGFDEVGCNYISFFFAYSDRSAALLLLRYYAHLIANQSVIAEVGTLVRLEGGRKAAERLHLQAFQKQPIQTETVTSHRAPLEDVLINEEVMKMIFQKQECPEEQQ